MKIANLTEIYGDISFDIEDQSPKTYVKFQAMHLKSFRAEIDMIQNVVTMENIPENQYREFLLKLVRYERKHEYNYNKSNYKAICGIRLELLLPRKLKSDKQRINIAKKFMRKINPINYKIPWIAYVVKRGTASYMILLMSEREYINRNEIKTYNRNYYDKQGNITHKQGDIQYRNGKPVQERILWSNKVRLFTYNRRTFEQLIKGLTEKFVIVVSSLLHHIAIRYRIKQHTVKAKWHYFNRKVCMEINSAKQFIEFHCNHALSIQRAKVTDPWLEEHLARSAPVPKRKEIDTIFHKYKARFEKECFHDQTGTLRKIAYKRVPLDVLQENLRVLKKEFQRELGTYVPEAFTAI